MWEIVRIDSKLSIDDTIRIIIFRTFIKEVLHDILYPKPDFGSWSENRSLKKLLC